MTAAESATYTRARVGRLREGSSHAGRAFGIAGVCGLALALVAGATEPRSSPARSQILDDLYDAALISPERGWVVGVFGTIYWTEDGGRRWTSQPTPTIEHLYGLAFADAEHGWAVGRAGTILKTEDGQRWTAQVSGTTKHLFMVEAIDEKVAWVVGDWGVVLHTENGGITWADRSLGADRILYSVDFADRRHGWMVGEMGGVFRTEDGGESWTEQPSGTDKTLFGVKALSAAHAWAVGIDGLILRTADGGATWQVQHGVAESADIGASASFDVLANPGLYEIDVVGDRGYVVGDIGTVLVSEDGGESWSAAPLPAEWRLRWVRGLSILPNGQGLIVGAGGLTFAVDGREMRFSQDRRRRAS